MDPQKLIANLRSPLFLISLTAVIALCLSHAIYSQQEQDLVETRTSHYGKALATLTAKQAANATLNGDLVSLQVALESITDNPHILSATLYDVENKLLVQAGDSPTLGKYSAKNSTTYTAPITLHDSIAGYIAVTVDTQTIWEQQDSRWFIGLIAVCLLVMAFSLTAKRVPQDQPENTNTAEQNANPTNRDTEDTETANSPTPNSNVSVTLLLHTQNIDALRKQISGSFREKLLTDLGKKIDGINMLYNGRIKHASEDWMTLQYGGDDITDASFRAACAAFLLFQLTNESNDSLQLQFSGVIYHQSDKRQLNQLLEDAKFTESCHQALLDAQPQQLLLHSDIHNDNLSQRLLIEGDAPWLNTKELQSGYSELLNKQSLQLKRMLAHL